MPHYPKPFFKRARGVWYVQIDRKQINLGSDRDAAFRRYHELMVKPAARKLSADSVVGLIDGFLEWCQKHRSPETYEWYRSRLQCFAKLHPNLTTRDLRPFHVQQWLDGMNGLASGSKRNYCRAVKRTMRWAQQQGYIDHNPIAFLEQPRAGRRETVLSPDEFSELLDLVADDSLRDLLIATWETGCRPQESLRVEARHVDLVNCRWVFPESEAKGGLLRIVYLTDKALAITRRLMLRSPTGKLFRNSTGVPWTTDAVNCAFTRLQAKIGRQRMVERKLDVDENEVAKLAASLCPTKTCRGEVVTKRDWQLKMEARVKLRNRLAASLAPRCSLYALRHSWATHALERGLDSLTVAVLMGHRDPGTLAKVYQHLAHNPNFLLGQAKRAVG